MKFYPLDRLIHDTRVINKRWKEGKLNDFQAYQELLSDYPDIVHQFNTIRAYDIELEDLVNALVDIHMKE